ncbi:MAG: efflux RND transporter periplasmic adaptor subunit [Deltaproteobacteria bacterium]|nr:efflux RND transporter periplasmic adaptor subunit [Deltaproteobacteria bacterium]MBW2394405.1 efflux RND transporter periplasmic adaptor subunit [Deltaproteobacteria bacterium]
MKTSYKKVLLPIGILCLGAAGVSLQLAGRKAAETVAPEVLAPLVEIIEVRPQPFAFVVHAQGTVVPRTESNLIPQVAGEVVWVSPALVSGGFFEAGESLVRLDDADHRAGVESARAALARSKSEEDRARKERKRQRSLAEQGVTSEARIDDAENAYRIADASMREATVRLENAQRDLARTEIRASYAGRVRSEVVDVGQFVTRGVAIARLYAVDWAEVRLPVPDRELRFLDVPLTYRPQREATSASSPEEKGPLVRLSAEFAGESHEWTGRIVRTEGEIDAKSRMITLVARVEDPYGADESPGRPPLAVGMFVRAEISGREVSDAFVLPRGALHEDRAVLVLDVGGRLRIRPVDVLRLERDEVVIGGGLEAGDQVCVTPLPGAIDGMAVRVAEGEPGTTNARAGL